jgi:hypothetical protein
MSGFSYKELYKQLEEEPTESTVINVVDELLKKTKVRADIERLTDLKDDLRMDIPAPPMEKEDKVLREIVFALKAYLRRLDPRIAGGRRKTRKSKKTRRTRRQRR